MSWTHDAHGNLRDDVISVTPRGGKVQHIAESVVHFSDVTFRVSTSGVKYQNIRNGGKRAVCAWMRGTLDNVAEIAGDPFRFEESPEWIRVSFNPKESGLLFHIKENGVRGDEVHTASQAVYVASAAFDNPTKTRVYIKRTN